MLVFGYDPIWGYEELFYSAFGSVKSIGEIFRAMAPLIFTALGFAVASRAGFFNVGLSGQALVGWVFAGWFALANPDLPRPVLIIATVVIAMLAGGIAGAIPGILRAYLGTSEVIVTIMMNWIAIFLADYLVGMNGPMRDPAASLPQSRPIQASARLARFNELPAIMANPAMRIVAALLVGIGLYLLVRLIVRYGFGGRFRKTSQWIVLGIGGVLTFLTWVLLGNLTMFGGPFTDKASRLHIGFLLACGIAVLMWWVLYKTTFGFEVRTVGANRDAARYAGINITRNVVLAMAISGALAGLAGTIEIVGLARVLQSFFSAGYGFESIAIALLANSHPLGTIPSAFLFGALRNGADLMELRSGVSKQMISVVQGLIVMFVAAPGMIRWIYHIKAPRGEKAASVTSGWGK